MKEKLKEFGLLKVWLFQGFQCGSVLKDTSTKQEMLVQSLGPEDPLEEAMAIHLSILAWQIQQTGSLESYSAWGHMNWTQLSNYTAVTVWLLQVCIGN